MASVRQLHSAGYPLDFSSQNCGVLDLSRTRKTPESYFTTTTSPVLKYERNPGRHSPVPEPSQLRTISPLRSTTPPNYIPGHHYRTPEPYYLNDSVSHTYNPMNRSPSFYSADKDTSVSPRERSGQSSPNYASSYPGPEHTRSLSPSYIIHAALHQQMLLHNQHQTQVKRKSESDANSEPGSDGSHSSTLAIYPMVPQGRDGKVARPFKAYPKDPMSLAAGFSSVDAVLDSQSAEKYTVFRKRMLDQICAANGGQATVSNPKMRRTLNGNMNTSSEDGGTKVDDSYMERRKKNNEAAKKSRDRRRIKEDEIAIRAAFLERENIELKFELAAAKKQLALCGIGSNQSS